jgi:branched-chain amino acid aminotransferase
VVTTFTFERAARRTGTATHQSLADTARSLPAGSYTTLRTYGAHRVLRLRQHVARLNESLVLTGRSGSLGEAAVRAAIASTLAETLHPESRMRLTYAPPRLFVSVEPFEPLPAALYEEGVACVTLDVQRANPHAKDTRFIATAAAAYAALPAGVHEGLLVGADGAILEGLSSNFFALHRGVLRTEERRALIGVTRSLVIEIATPVAPVSSTAVMRDELDAVAEAFITSVSRGILPVVAINSRAIGSGQPGPVTRELMRRFVEMQEREAEEL